MALGKWTGTDLAAVGAQGQKLIADVSKLPNSNALVLFDGQWVLTTTLSSDSDIEYGKPAVVLTSVGSRPPFAFTRTIGVGGGSSGNYQCQIGESHRSISSMRSETSCRSIYRREDGDVQVIWETPTHPEACAAKAAEFSKYLATIGVSLQRSLASLQCFRAHTVFESPTKLREACVTSISGHPDEVDDADQ